MQHQIVQHHLVQHENRATSNRIQYENSLPLSSATLRNTTSNSGNIKY